MKRRAFFAVIVGVFAAPAVAKPPKAHLELLPDTSALVWRARELDALSRYEFAEWQAAQMLAIASAIDSPMTHEEICDLFRVDAYRLGWT